MPRSRREAISSPILAPSVTSLPFRGIRLQSNKYTRARCRGHIVSLFQGAMALARAGYFRCGPATRADAAIDIGA